MAEYTDADLEAVRRAIAKGERSVQFENRSVTYRSMDELFQAEERISSALATTNQRPKQFYAVASKGF